MSIETLKDTCPHKVQCQTQTECDNAERLKAREGFGVFIVRVAPLRFEWLAWKNEGAQRYQQHGVTVTRRAALGAAMAWLLEGDL
jgi:hypothetical protein